MVDKSLLANFKAAPGTIGISRTNEADASPDNASVTLTSTTTTSGSTSYVN